LKELRETHLERLASALASTGNLHKQNVLKQLRQRESQRATAKKIKFIRGKLNRNSTIIVTETLSDGTTVDITDKRFFNLTHRLLNLSLVREALYCRLLQQRLFCGNYGTTWSP
jgi:hypothetical protein